MKGLVRISARELAEAKKNLFLDGGVQKGLGGHEVNLHNVIRGDHG